MNVADTDDCCTAPAFAEVSGRTLPHLVDGRFVYECAYENPHPGVAPISLRYVPREGKEDIGVELISIRYE